MVLHWAPLEVTWYSLSDGFRIIVETDVPCHLYMAWGTTIPQKHNMAVLLRGIELMNDPYYCLAGVRDNEQEEAGDTLIHTFDKRTWPVCETRYFYFWGFIGPQKSPSASAIFKLHRTETPIPATTGWLTASPENRAIRYSWGTWPICHNNTFGTVLPFYAGPWYQIACESTLTASYFIQRGFQRWDTSIIPAGSTIVAAQVSLWFWAKSLVSAFPTPHICITQGIQSTPIVSTDYGAQLGLPTVGGLIHTNDIVLNQYNDIDLNSNGLAWIVPGGESRFCIRHEADVADVAPGLGQNSAHWYSVQNPANVKPRLQVWYVPP